MATAAVAAPPIYGTPRLEAPNQFSQPQTVPQIIINGALVSGFHANNLTNTSVGATAFSPFNGQALNTNNTAFGANALAGVTVLPNNTAFGTNALQTLSGTGGANETAIGNRALQLDLAGTNNTSVGSDTMRYFTGAGNANGNVALGHGSMGGDDVAPVSMTGSGNTAIGAWSDQEITTGTRNTFLGDSAGLEINIGQDNTSAGFYSNAGCNGCLDNIAGVTGSSFNTSFGAWTLENNTANGQVAFGWSALKANTTGSLSTAIGYQALLNSVADVRNTAIGNNSMNACNGCNDNTGIGYQTGVAFTTGGQNTLIGSTTGTKLTTGAGNVIIGAYTGTQTLTTGSHNIIIGVGVNTTDTLAAATSNEINIGNLLFYNTASIAAPALSACGTSSIDAHANNRSGTLSITAGTPASCTATFAGSGYSTFNHCRVTSESVNANFAYSYSLTSIVITGTALAGKIDYDCDGV